MPLDLPVIALLDVIEYGTTQFKAYSATPIGPYFRGTDRYVVWYNLGTSKGEATKSTHGGLTWTVQDEADEPAVLRGSRQSADILYVALVAPPLYELFITTFDMSTDQWGTPGTAGPDPAIPLLAMEWGTAGVLRCVHPFGNGLRIRDYNIGGDTWGSATTIPSAVALQVKCCNADPDGKLHIIYGPSSGATLDYVQVLTDGTLTTPVSLLSLGVELWTYGAFLGTKFIVPARTAGGNVAAILVDPYTSETPSITVEDLGYACQLTGQACSGNGKAYIFFQTNGAREIDYIEYDGASFGSKITWHDQVASLVPNTIEASIHNMMPPVVRPDGGLAEIFALDYKPLTTIFCTSFYSENGVPAAVELITVTDVVDVFLPPPLPPGGGAAGNNNTMLLLDLSEARATLPDYD